MSSLLERQFYLRQELDEHKYKGTAYRNIIINIIIIIIIIIIIVIFLFNRPQFFALSQYVAKTNLANFHSLCFKFVILNVDFNYIHQSFA